MVLLHVHLFGFISKTFISNVESEEENEHSDAEQSIEENTNASLTAKISPDVAEQRAKQ